MNVLIVRLGALGDVINVFPLAVLLKKELKARITWLVAPLSLPLVEKHPCVDEVILFDRKNAFSSAVEVIKKIRSVKFDITLDLQRILKSGFFALFSKSKRKIGFDKARCKEHTYLLPFERIPEKNKTSHMVLQYLEFAEYLGIKNKSVSWEIPYFEAPYFNLPKSYIVLNIGASTSAKRWSAEGFAKLADLIKKELDITSVLTGGKEDIKLSYDIEKLSKTDIINLAGRTSVNELRYVLQNAEAAVTSDTGPMHLSRALGTKTIALIGPTDYRRTGPFNGVVITKKLPCSPCNKKKCKDPVCMSSITPENVLRYLKN